MSKRKPASLLSGELRPLTQDEIRQARARYLRDLLAEAVKAAAHDPQFRRALLKAVKATKDKRGALRKGMTETKLEMYAGVDFLRRKHTGKMGGRINALATIDGAAKRVSAVLGVSKSTVTSAYYEVEHFINPK